MGFVLRDYQTDLIQNVSKCWRQGFKRPCIVLPCGGGKSVIVADIAKRTTDNGKRVLFLVHRKELCQQIEDTFRAYGVDMDLCTVGMVQTITRRLTKIPAPVLIITDENHHCLAESYKRIYNYFDCFCVGVTATPVRLDGSGLGDVNDRLVIGVSAKWLIQNNYLAPYDYYAPSIVDCTGLKIKNGEFDTSQIEDIMIEKAVFGDVIKHYRQLADGVQTVCYCPTIKYSKFMVGKFRQAGISAEHIDGETPTAEREKIIADFRKGDVKILCNVDLISEGFDVPDCGCTILLRPTQSLTLYIQQSMRCMRYKPDKRAVIIDHVGNVHRFGLPDADREWKLDAKKKKLRGESNSVHVKQCPECFFTYESAPSCPNCGYVPEKKTAEIETKEDAELRKITEKVAGMKSSKECSTMKELSAFAKKKGYKNGWTWYEARRLGIWR